MRYGVAGFGCLCAVLWVLLGFCVLVGHGSSVSGWWGGAGRGASFLLSHAGVFCGFVCGVVCLSEYDTPKPYLFYEIRHMDGSSFSQVPLEALGLFGV